MKPQGGVLRTAALSVGGAVALAFTGLLTLPWPALAGVVNADVVAIDQVLWYNRLGAVTPVGMIYALKSDVVAVTGATPGPGNAMLREDKRPRPIVLRVNEGDTLHITFTNWLNPTALVAPAPGGDPLVEVEQPATRQAGITVFGMQMVGSIASDGSNVGRNASSLAAPGETRTYSLYAEKEGAYLLNSTAANTGGEGQMGTLAFGLFGTVNVEPAGSTWYRSQLTRQEMDWATTGSTPAGQPLLNYEAVYPDGHPFAGRPILRMLDRGNLVHSDIHAIITGFAPNHYPPNPAYPNRNEPFREFTVVFHDEIAAVQAFPAFYDQVASPLGFMLGSVKDGFAINYATGGIGTEILANRLGVGPMFDCVDCKAEEFFLTSWVVGDPGMVVDVPANAGLERLAPGQVPDDADVGPKATVAFYPDDPSNVNHSYMNDHVKIRNVHAGREHHIFHLHTHQWLFTPDDDNSNYIDFQGIGPGSSYTYEIAYEGSGNRNKTPGDAIYHCHFYPHFAQGMWAHWRVHDVFENGTQIDPATGKPVPGARALPDAEILAGTPIPALVPIPDLPMAPMPGAVHIDNTTGQIVFDEPNVNPGFPFFIAGKAGHRPPTPPLDIAAGPAGLLDGGLERHIITGGTALSEVTPLRLNKVLETATVELVPEEGTAVEKTAMAYHAEQWHPTYTTDGRQASFELNGLPPQRGAPYADPCRADAGGPTGNYRTYRPVVIELDTVFNKAGWHFGQQRIEVLEQDVAATLAKTRPPEPLVMRANTGDCMEVFHTNLVPSVYQQDAFQVKMPTDVIGQHIHLVKFDVTSSDGAANGWNYEDGTFSPDEVIERIHAIRAQNVCPNDDPNVFCPVEKAGFNGVLGARTTVQRVYVDPLLNNDGVDRGLGNVFTHDHYGPSTHQQAGLYATV
ncbi:MAG: copper oxidase, partial [Deltaproteobacteria bacterium]|nr:copper oxidase [Deltaproteobacteria bacterium]